MNKGDGFKCEQLFGELQAIATAVGALANQYQGDSLALLAVLRQLEDLHRQIRDGIFQAALPDNRQALYSLLKDIEAEGGWPYIERMKLQSFLINLPVEVGDHVERSAGSDRTIKEDSELNLESDKIELG